jgi:hypothetical protein
VRQSASLSTGHEKVEKKEGLGVFAKLLAGLLQKTNKPGAAGSGAEKSETGEKPGKTRSGGPAISEDAAETGETLLTAADPRPGKNRARLRDGGTAEGITKTDTLPGKEKKRAKSLSSDDADTELAAAALVRSAVPDEGGDAEGAVTEGEAVNAAQARQGDLSPEGTPGGGEGTPDADTFFDGASASLTHAEAAGQERSAGTRDREGETPERSTGDLSRYAAEDPLAGTPGAGRNVRSPFRPAAEKDGRTGGSAETRLKERRRERSNPEAGDMRAGLDKRDGAESLRSFTEAGNGEEAEVRKGGETELVVELRSQGKTQTEISVERENRPVQSFQNTLAWELHENLNGDIVRHASVMLREGGEGTIRLSLRPETLGTVKIRLEIAENKIVGSITVESDDAFRAFEQELHSLEQSFRDSGFDGASLEMAFASDGQEGRRKREGEADSLFSGRLAALRYDAALSGVSENPDEGLWLGIRPGSQGRPLVNMLV